jgi:CelD/BcsL family acetyltransferase involved in cellulose biosynthesis
MALPTRPGRLVDESLMSDFTAATLPALEPRLAPSAILSFLNGCTRPYLLRAVPEASAFYAQLQAVAPRLAVLHRWERAALRVEGGFESWMAENFDHKRRKELKRLHKRLAEQGDLKLETLNDSKDLPRFAEALLELEAKGWKGQRGTALKADAAKTETFRAICQGLMASGSLRFWLMRFNGQPIAALFGKVAGGQGWIIKIAHDEAFAKYSPGVLTVIAATEAFFAEEGLRLVDSCAVPGHPMIDRIWRDRITMVDVLVAPSQVSAARFSLTRSLLLAKASLRGRAKSIFYRITKRKRS